MAREYSNKRTSRQRGSAPHQFLVIVVTFLLGYLTASLFDVETIGHWMNTQVLAHHEVKKQPIKAEAQQAQIPPKPKFEFYTLLANEKAGGAAQSNPNVAHTAKVAHANPAQVANPTKSAAVASAATHASVKPNTQQQVPVKIAEGKPVPSYAGKGAYLVQVAAFKAQHDAEHMKGLLTLKGFNVTVVPIQAKGNWFRVVVGPYSNRALAQKAQMSLARNERLRGMVING